MGVFHSVLLKYGNENAEMQKRKFEDATLRYSIGEPFGPIGEPFGPNFFYKPMCDLFYEKLDILTDSGCHSVHLHWLWACL